MKRAIVLLSAVVWAMGCSTAIQWEKSGASEAQRQRDLAECVSLASREQIPGSAYTGGASTTTPLTEQRARISYDPTVADRCMADRGYQRVAPGRPPG
jgi:hypothetical protein